MMRSKQYSGSATRAVLSLFLLIALISGCTSSTAPTYTKERIDEALEDICKQEYGIQISAKLFGETLWIYFPVQNLLSPSEKPRKFLELYKIEKIENKASGNLINVEYEISSTPPKEISDNVQFNKKVSEEIGEIWRVVRRVTFSIEHTSASEPKFYCLVTADITSGIEIRTTSYYLDLKKVSYGLISNDEYQHRVLQDTAASEEIIRDTTGRHIIYKDINMKEFILGQIEQRIKLKFQRPELDKNADIDKEVLKIVEYTLKTYDFRDFSFVEVENLISNYKALLNKAAILGKPTENKY